MSFIKDRESKNKICVINEVIYYSKKHPNNKKIAFDMFLRNIRGCLDDLRLIVIEYEGAEALCLELRFYDYELEIIERFSDCFNDFEEEEEDIKTYERVIKKFNIFNFHKGDLKQAWEKCAKALFDFVEEKEQFYKDFERDEEKFIDYCFDIKEENLGEE